MTAPTIPDADALTGWRKSSYNGNESGICLEVLDGHIAAAAWASFRCQTARATAVFSSRTPGVRGWRLASSWTMLRIAGRSRTSPGLAR